MVAGAFDEAALKSDRDEDTAWTTLCKSPKATDLLTSADEDQNRGAANWSAYRQLEGGAPTDRRSGARRPAGSIALTQIEFKRTRVSA
jgi:hypothetical protein